jgi:hypothetical protein
MQTLKTVNAALTKIPKIADKVYLTAFTAGSQEIKLRKQNGPKCTIGIIAVI